MYTTTYNLAPLNYLQTWVTYCIHGSLNHGALDVYHLDDLTDIIDYWFSTTAFDASLCYMEKSHELFFFIAVPLWNILCIYFLLTVLSFLWSILVIVIKTKFLGLNKKTPINYHRYTNFLSGRNRNESLYESFWYQTIHNHFPISIRKHQVIMKACCWVFEVAWTFIYSAVSPAWKTCVRMNRSQVLTGSTSKVLCSTCGS